MINLYNIDCMKFMADKPDKYYDLAIVDPPYGIGIGGQVGSNKAQWTKYENKEWDTLPPDDKYFIKMKRISKNQIIWGANYFSVFPSRCFLVWDKMIGDNNFSMAELAYTSFNTPSKIFKHYHG
ncbi:hypothetical protein LCGC14_2830600, partial [marine sediment metagenome]